MCFLSEHVRVDAVNPDPATVRRAVDVMRDGGVIAFPTETFYGLGVDPSQDAALHRLFEVKGRDFRNPIPLIISDRTVLTELASDIPDAAVRLMDRFWPGPLTLVFRARSSVSSVITAGLGTVGVRHAGSLLARLLAEGLSGVITATSANSSGFRPCTTGVMARHHLEGKIDLVLDGGTVPGGLPSTVVDVTKDIPAVIRVGVIPAEDISRT